VTNNRDDDEAVDCDFDGHLEWPIERMSTSQRLDFLTQTAWLAYWGKQSRSAAPKNRDQVCDQGDAVA
jgi:hypothetical protein